MNLKRFFKQRIVIISIVLVIATGGLGTLAWDNNALRGIQQVSTDNFWITIAQFREKTVAPGTMCSLGATRPILFGWPFQFIAFLISGCGGPSITVRVNPISILVDFAMFAAIAYLLTDIARNIRKYLTKKIVLAGIIAVVLTTFLLLPRVTYNVISFHVYEFIYNTPNDCGVNIGNTHGWPLTFVSLWSCEGITTDVYFDPISLIADLVIFMIIVKLLLDIHDRGKGKKITKSRK